MIYAAIPLLFIQLWVLFLSYIQIKAKWTDLSFAVKVVGVVVVLLGFILDVCLNWTVGLFLGVTKDFTLSQKCKRLRKENMGWRGDVAEYLCTRWLNPFDKDHC